MLPTIADAEAAARREFLEENKEADQLLEAMLDASAEMLGDLSGVQLSRAQQFRVFILSQSWNAAASAIQQLKSGYPRTSLMMPRLISEGIAAATWAEGDPAAAERCLDDYFERKNWPEGTWPKRSVTLESLDEVYDEVAQRVFKTFRDTENALYAHALSDLAIDAVRTDGPVLETILGPRTTALSRTAARHLVPTLAALLFAVGRLVDEVAQADTSAAARLHNDALNWSVKNPPPVHSKEVRKLEGTRP